MNQSKFGKGTKFWYPELSNIGKAVFGKDCIIHSNVWVADRVKVGDRCRIQAFCFLPEGVRLGDDVFLGPGVVFTNDKHPPSTEWEVTIVEDFVSIGANVTILPGLTLRKGCKIGAGSVVTKNIPPNETWVGNPARKLTD